MQKRRCTRGGRRPERTAERRLDVLDHTARGRSARLHDAGTEDDPETQLTTRPDGGAAFMTHAAPSDTVGQCCPCPAPLATGTAAGVRARGGGGGAGHVRSASRGGFLHAREATARLPRAGS